MEILKPDYSVDDRKTVTANSSTAQGMLRVQIIRKDVTVQTVWLVPSNNDFQLEDWRQTTIDVVAGDVVRYDIRPGPAGEFSNYECPPPTVEATDERVSAEWLVRVAIS